MAAPQTGKRVMLWLREVKKRVVAWREVVLRNLSERKREGQKLLMADLKRMTEKTIDTGAGNKSDEKATSRKMASMRSAER